MQGYVFTETEWGQFTNVKRFANGDSPIFCQFKLGPEHQAKVAAGGNGVYLVCREEAVQHNGNRKHDLYNSLHNPTTTEEAMELFRGFSEPEKIEDLHSLGFTRIGGFETLTDPNLCVLRQQHRQLTRHLKYLLDVSSDMIRDRSIKYADKPTWYGFWRQQYQYFMASDILCCANPPRTINNKSRSEDSGESMLYSFLLPAPEYDYPHDIKHGFMAVIGNELSDGLLQNKLIWFFAFHRIHETMQMSSLAATRKFMLSKKGRGLARHLIAETAEDEDFENFSDFLNIIEVFDTTEYQAAYDSIRSELEQSTKQ